ncbi:hypothetical protein ACO0KY_19625 [Undibacterium sp. Dicai25W]|uniref:hypothetical protein n=1 Tax=Undibacterium sp. Dicai25W TaxID=3413034 RepID=UPI003BF43C2B
MNKETNTNTNKTKQIICRMDDELFAELEIIREQLGVNWSFQVRHFLKNKVDELKSSNKPKIKI